MDEEERDEGSRAGTLAFFDEDEDKGEEEEESPAKLKDDVRVSVLSCTKQGNDWAYQMKVTFSGEERELQRWYKDVQWLHRSLNRNIDIGGYILPPMPDNPSNIPDLPAAAIIGTEGEAMFGGLNRRHTLRMEKFLNELAAHRFFSENHMVNSYLISPQLSTMIKDQEKIGSGTMWAHLTKVFSDYQLGKIQDPDESMDLFLKYVNSTIPVLKSAYESSSTYIFKCQNLANRYVDVRTELRNLAAVDTNKAAVRSETQMAEVILDISITEALMSLDGALTVAATFSHQTHYFIECKDMLLRRVAVLQALLNATNYLDKAKPEKKEVAEKTKEKFEVQFNSISKTAQAEMQEFEKQYRSSLKSSILSYTEAQIAHGKRTVESFTRIRDTLMNQVD